MKGIRLIMVIGCLLASHSALAATTTGTVNVNLILSNSCVVNGSTATTGVPMGTLDFGTQPTTFSQLITQLSNNAGTTFTVQCPPNDTFTVALTSSTNTAPTTPHGTQIGSTPRYVNLANNSHGVYYGVFDSNPSPKPGTALANNATITPVSGPTNGVSTYTLYGLIQGNGTNAGIIAGTYTDVVNLTVTY
ncbi:spore coat protein U domain-containing protein [Arsenophonus nasoniae]|uniref:Spore Coat Protein U domain protein n=1 Tax=Arsenophonus nasoniae TaxID=638 RepID=A0A4P7KNV9_9GAMM|nr:spore coat protein U domain-containing protein [Arsenophonus nasoniae]QBY41589.1 Spore Coat Protein U domain protein [Arsenophonus nasoniae]WGM05792.1 spore coat protein U domain-containing protein [Arsenophonus nasoniae]WGM10804.1 spore coat protein U domain-containing protein [Arsenophonus nasoniae]WGM15511.1 spore coat protein U domain-containing protein [Arsenophonus nasoniae]